MEEKLIFILPHLLMEIICCKVWTLLVGLQKIIIIHISLKNNIQADIGIKVLE